MSPGQFKKLDFEGLSMFVLLQLPSIPDVQKYMNKMWSKELGIPVIVISRNIKVTWRNLLLKGPMIYAAGGVVQRQDGKYLFIQRRGWWDLPKGKLDKGETKRKAAIREVKEEVGLDCRITSTLPNTYHCYIEKGRLVIKETAWYMMECKEDRVILQAEEDIIAKKWVSKNGFGKLKPNLYDNLKILLEALK